MRTGLVAVARDREDSEAFLLKSGSAGNPAISGLALRPEALRPHLAVGMLTKRHSSSTKIRY